jgi:AcrR family transcriptional regulator
MFVAGTMLAGVGVATLIGDAGLTHGGFDSHFASKKALIEEVIDFGIDETFARITEATRRAAERGFHPLLSSSQPFRASGERLSGSCAGARDWQLLAARPESLYEEIGADGFAHRVVASLLGRRSCSGHFRDSGRRVAVAERFPTPNFPNSS